MLTEQVLEILDQLNIPRVETTDQLLARYLSRSPRLGYGYVNI